MTDPRQENERWTSPINQNNKVPTRSNRTSLLALLAILAVVTAGIFCVYTGVPNLIKDWVKSFSVQSPSAQIKSSQTMFQSIKSLGQLVTLRAEVAKSGIEVITRYGVANICRIGANHVAQGTIEGGIDLSLVVPENIIFDEKTDSYIIQLPSARLTGCYIDPVSTQQYNTWGATAACPMDFDEMRRLASYVAINEFRDDAIEGGFLIEAQVHAESVVTNFVMALTGKNVIVEFLPRENSMPLSCTPNPPGQWKYDSDSGLWSKP